MNHSPLHTNLLEGIEADFVYGHQSGASEAKRENRGIASAPIGGGVPPSMRNPSAYWNKALAIDIDEPVTGDLIEEAVAFYRSQRAPRVGIQIAPEFWPAHGEDVAAAHGLRGLEFMA